MFQNGVQGQQGSGRVAPRSADASRLGNLGSCQHFGKAIRPRLVESIIGRDVNDNAGALAKRLDIWLADAVGESHDPAVDLAVPVQTGDVLGRQVLVDDLALGVSLEFLATELARRNVSKIHVGMVVEQINQGLAGVAAGADEADPGRGVVGGILLAQRRVRVRVDGV